MSSRNSRLDPTQRRAAVCVPRSLQAVVDAFDRGERDAHTLAAFGRAVIDAEPLARVEHLELVDAVTLSPMPIVDQHTMVVIAVWLGDVRLIDNRRLA